MPKTITKKIYDELKDLRKDIKFIKKNMIDVDSVMTREDYSALEAYKKEKKNNKLISHEKLKKELGV